MLTGCPEGACTLGAMVTQVVSAPATLVALAAIALGFALWWWRDALAWLSRPLAPLARFAQDGLGFEWLNRQIIAGTNESATALRVTQTGQPGPCTTSSCAGSSDSRP